MDSWKIMQWLDEAYSDAPSIYLPGAAAPVDRQSEQYKLAVAKQDESWKELVDIALPAYDQCIKASHLFNLLDARGVISVTERQAYIGRVRALAKLCADAFVRTEAGGHGMGAAA